MIVFEVLGLHSRVQSSTDVINLLSVCSRSCSYDIEHQGQSR